ncbi:hypothetical protein FTO74_00530 [Granulicella sp. WH15]|uniref:hypothetical protein n=1 Tax=Granulicella sp. WH15 TaxID=2602070 RepID=UPI001367294E|nr:hypothetical protein [Granulicella sp. WH15]QHN02033.1 hypothetical protein FTO74_00530 [Granulicella sp. WH15]
MATFFIRRYYPVHEEFFNLKIGPCPKEVLNDSRFEATVAIHAPSSTSPEQRNFRRNFRANSMECLAEQLSKRWEISLSSEFEAIIAKGSIVCGNNQISDQDVARYFAP